MYPSSITYEILDCDPNDRVIFRGIWGSHAYGTNTPESDHDTVGIYVLERDSYLHLGDPMDHVADARSDNHFYSLRNFCSLAHNANPNLLDALYMPDDCILKTTRYWEMLKAERNLFVSRKASKTYCDYAFAQIKRAKGCNKRVHHPQPVEAPTEEGFCKIIPLHSATCGMPGRPISLQEAGINLAHCHVAALENSTELYRLYLYGPEAKGVFRGGNLVCESIPKEDEHTHFVGLLLFQKNALLHARTEHRQYWDWYNNRNPVRWQTQLTGKMDYDAKNMMHTFRLLYSGAHILTTGEPLVRFTGEKLAKLMAIRKGEFAYDALVQEASELMENLQSLREKSTLPEEADTPRINDLLCEITTLWENDHAR